MGSPYRIQVRIGSHEFVAEGDESSVRADYQRFLTQIGQTTIAAPTILTDIPERPVRHTAMMAQADLRLSPYEIEQLYAVEGEAVFLKVKLRTLERGPDGLLLLVLGFHQVLGKVEVEAGVLKKCGWKSPIGTQGLRLDRLMLKRAKYLDKEGISRGTSYALNVLGWRYAVELARQTLK